MAQGPVLLMGWITEGASVPLSLRGSHRLVGRIVITEMEVHRRSYSVQNQDSPEFEPGSFIISGGPALLQVLEPGHISTHY